MTKSMTLLSLCTTLLLGGLALSKTAEDNPDEGKKVTQQACTPCHSLRIVENQRLSEAAWQKELDKMIGWGAVVPDRQAMISYLIRHYSNTQPPATSVLSADAK